MQGTLAFVSGAAALVSFLEVAQEHYTGSFGQRIMYTPLICCVLLGVTGLFAAFFPFLANTVLPLIAVIFILDCLIGFGFHIRGIARKPGGWVRNFVNNIVMGPPIFAPLVLSLSAFLALIAAYLLPETSAVELSPKRAEMLRCILAFAAGLYGALNGCEALYSHYKSRFKSIFQWIPVLLAPPLALVSFLTIFFPGDMRSSLETLSLIAIAAGSIGVFFHIRGIFKRPGGFRHLGYNIIYGPPVFAPLLFAATGLLGLLAIEIGRVS